MKLAELQELHSLPFFELLKRAREVHEQSWPDGKIQLCTLLSIKTGGCAEDCGYCPQSAHHAKTTGQAKETMFDVEDVLSRRTRSTARRSTAAPTAKLTAKATVAPSAARASRAPLARRRAASALPRCRPDPTCFPPSAT